MPFLVRCGSRSKTKKLTVEMNGSVRFALLTVRLKNGTVTVALAVKKRYGKKNGKRYGHGTVRYGHGTVRYGHGTDTVRTRYGNKFGPPTVYHF